MNYPHKTIWINGRTVLLEDIIEGTAIRETTFEHTTFQFIRDWLKGDKTFELQTSGSTGVPKKIILERHQMEASAMMTARALNLHHGLHALVALDTKYIAGKMMIVRSLVTGMTITAVEPSSNPFDQLPPDFTIDFAALVPLQIQTILESKTPQFIGRIQTIIIGGAPLNKETAEKLKSFSNNFYLTYGMTETISHIALKNIKHNADSFEVLPGVDIETDERGCLVIKTPFLKEKVITNDVVAIFNSRSFKWVGRWDNIINSGGVKISPEKIEEVIGKIFTRLNIKQPFFIYGAPDKRLGEKLVLVIEGKNSDVLDLPAIVNELIHTLTPYERPKEIYTLENFSFTPTMKINRQDTFQKSSLQIIL